jgi:hypothetical protein
VSVAVDSDRDQSVHVYHPPTLKDLEYERVRGQECVGAGVQRAGAELLNLLASSVAMTLTCDFDGRVMPRVSTSFSIRRVDTPSR